MKNLLSHSRNIHVNLTERTVKYAIPICVEKAHLGMFRSIEIKDNEILVRFDTVSTEIQIPRENSIIVEKTEKVVSFS